MNKNLTAAFQMIVPATVLKQWQDRKSRGDLVNIHKLTKLSRPTIIKAINLGIASPSTILKISSYYGRKKSTSPEDIEHQALKILNSKE